MCGPWTKKRESLLILELTGRCYAISIRLVDGQLVSFHRWIFNHCLVKFYNAKKMMATELIYFQCQRPPSLSSHLSSTAVDEQFHPNKIIKWHSLWRQINYLGISLKYEARGWSRKKLSVGLKATEEFAIITCSQFLIEMIDFVLVARRVAL